MSIAVCCQMMRISDLIVVSLTKSFIHTGFLAIIGTNSV